MFVKVLENTINQVNIEMHKDLLEQLDKINKVVSGQNKKVEKQLVNIYSKLTKGKIFLAKNIKVAEASKVIENSQRDINIAFINTKK